MSTFNSDSAVADLKAFAEKRIASTPFSYDVTTVNVDLDAVVLREYKAELYASWDQATSLRGYNLGFTQEELGKYVDMLVMTRIAYVLGKRVSVKPTDGIAVPSYLSLVLSNVGLARNPELGIELRPSYDESWVIDEDFMVKMSRAIKVLASLGIEYAEGYTRSRDGSYDFMSMVLIGEFVRNGSNTAHPVYALMAATLGVRGIETVLSPRINYGSISHMRSLVRHLTTVKG